SADEGGRVAEMKTALVTGGNRGIGLETCRQLARRGYRVVLGARDEARGQDAARSLAGDGEVVWRRVGVTGVAGLAALAQPRGRGQALERELGGVDVLVNNAAVLLDEETPILDLPIETARETFETNLFGALAACQAFVPGMLRRRFGRVVNVSSGAGLLSYME